MKSVRSRERQSASRPGQRERQPDDLSQDIPLSHSFISYLSENPGELARELVRPYLSYEQDLRAQFMTPNCEIDALANLTPVYDGHEASFKIRTLDRKKTDPQKIIMPLPEVALAEDGQLAIVPTLPDFEENFKAYTRG